MADGEPPWQGEPIGAIPPLPWIDCKSLPDSGQDKEPIKGEKPTNQEAMQKCFGGGGVPPIPGSGNPGRPGDGGGTPLPPGSEIPECDTGDSKIDNTGDLREQLMAKSLADPDQPLEHGGLFWPDGNGGYDLLEFGIDIVGGSSQACRIVSPPYESFPPADQWPSGVIFFHTHPYSPGDNACGGTILGGASPADRNYVDWLRNAFEESVHGMVMDKDGIYIYGNNVSEDEPAVERCK